MADNTGNVSGNQQDPQRKPMHKCGEVGSYGGLSNKGSANQAPRKGKKRGARVWERDHVPSKAALFKRAEDKLGLTKGDDLYKCVTGKLEYQGRAICIPRKTHRAYSRTCADNNTAKQISDDAKDPDKAIEEDAKKVIEGLKKDKPECVAAYKKAIEEIKKTHDAKGIDDMIAKAHKECTA